jgi:uncharacterized 2Fe-2S/4Fe-4S cluster protein (DUF4445 family)
MARLLITSEGKLAAIDFTPGQSLRDLLDLTDRRVRSGCRGSGACGLCRVRIEEGNVEGPTKNEIHALSPEELSRGVRLACQTVPREDLRITIVNPAPTSNWRSLGPEEIPKGPIIASSRKKAWDHKRYGVAVDLGTTHISLSFWQMADAVRLSGRFGLNQQLHYGSDVMTRLVSAHWSGEHAGAISRATRDSIGDALLDICSREGYDPGEIGHMAIVGNTAMLSLLTGRGFELLLRPEYWTREIDCEPVGTGGWFASRDLPHDMTVEIVQPLAGFVGSDLLAGLIATELAQDTRPALLIDFGTNSEIALWDGRVLWATSAAGGPAFEGGGARCAMPAGPGAVYRIDEPDGRLVPQVIGTGKAKGFCGSGMVDIVAHLVRTGRVDRIGNCATGSNGGVPGEIRHIMPEKKDIDAFQRAKAAIASGVKFLMDGARLQARDLGKLCVCGVFGRYLNVRNAQDIGLLPPCPSERVELMGNAALAGCEALLLSSEMRDRMSLLRKKCRLVNLSQAAEFEDLFLENLYLQPM